MAFLIGGANTLSADYDIENSLRVNGDNHHLSMVFDSAASNRKTWTFSCWVKLGNAAQMATAYASNKYILCSTDAATSTTSIGYGYTAGDFHIQDGRSGTYIYTTSKFRDPSAWYHLVVRYDSTQGTASDRIFIYVNNVSQTLAYSNTGDPEVDQDTAVDLFLAGDDVDADSADSGNYVHNVNSYYNSGYSDANFLDGYLAEMYLINAQSLAPTAFGKSDGDSGIWKPINYTGSFNSHSFKLEFKQTGTSADASGIGADTSGQDNHFKVGANSNTAAIDQCTDSPTNNFATWNPLDLDLSSTPTLSEGNVKLYQPGSGGSSNCNFGVTAGKWYVEAFIPDVSNIWLGVAPQNLGNGVNHFSANYTIGLYGIAGTVYQNGLDMDNHNIYFGLNGNWSDGIGGGFDQSDFGNAAAFSFNDGGGFYVFTEVNGGGVTDHTVHMNFGNPSFTISSSNADANGYGNFEFAVPSNYYALCTKNLAEYG